MAAIRTETGGESNNSGFWLHRILLLTNYESSYTLGEVKSMRDIWRVVTRGQGRGAST